MALPFVSDSRRLTGASMVLPLPGAILEVAAPKPQAIKLRVLWRNHARKLLDRIGWEREQIVTRDRGPSQILAITAPIDALLPATYLTEWAWHAALAQMKLFEPAVSLAQITDEILARIVKEANPALASLYRAAKLRGVTTLLEKELSLGEGHDCKVYPLDDLPPADRIAWRPKRRKLPIVLVTGTNGKTTTVRLLARMIRETGQRVGFCSTDFVQIGEEILQRDDYSGPTGARIVLRHPDTEFAVLEVARGGMLRRGMQVHDADVGIVTNVADDHLGENGVHTLDQLAEAKFTLTRGLRTNAPLIVNADDPHCRALARRLERPIFWFAMNPPESYPKDLLKTRRARAGFAFLQDEQLMLDFAGERQSLLSLTEVPLTLAGVARYNIGNALAAIAAATVMKIDPAAMLRALRDFASKPSDNPGRCNQFNIRGAKVISDYGHNPDGIRALLDASAKLDAKRRLVLVGLAGDRIAKRLEG